MENVHISYRCYYEDGEPNNHHRDMLLADIPRWIEAYKFTHPNCTSISVKVWFTKGE